VDEGIRVRVEVDEPFDLVKDSQELVFVMGRVVGEESGRDELVIKVDEGSTLGGQVIKTIVATPRYRGHTFEELRAADVIVNARAETDGEDVHFLGSVAVVED